MSFLPPQSSLPGGDSTTEQVTLCSVLGKDTGERLPSSSQALWEGSHGGWDRQTLRCLLPPQLLCASQPLAYGKRLSPVVPANEGELHPPRNWSASSWYLKKCL